jgi:hypothetical protein
VLGLQAGSTTPSLSPIFKSLESERVGSFMSSLGGDGVRGAGLPGTLGIEWSGQGTEFRNLESKRPHRLSGEKAQDL